MNDTRVNSMNTMDLSRYQQFNDRELVSLILSNDSKAIEYFFIEKCSKVFVYIIESVFGGRIQKDELLNELFLYIANNDWKKLRDFDFRSNIMTWISVIAIRFFIRKRDSLIESTSHNTLINLAEVIPCPSSALEDKITINMAIDLMPNERYRRVIKMLDIEGCSHSETAQFLGISQPNLYNVHRRAIAQLKLMLI